MRAGDGGFARDGFAILRGFLEADEVARLRPAVDALLSRPLPPGCERPHNTLAPLRWDDEIVDRVLSSRPRRERVAYAAGARDLRWISGYVSVKHARSQALWWHQDWWCWDHPVSYRRATTQLAVLCYLADTTAANGSLRVLPGSHHASTSLHALLPEPHAGAADALDPAHPAMSDQPGQQTLELRAGDAVVTDYRLLHGTHGNASAERRDCLVLTFTPNWRELPGELRAHLIRHPAQPGRTERVRSRSWQSEALPRYSGQRRDLPLNRTAPARFEMVD